MLQRLMGSTSGASLPGKSFSRRRALTHAGTFAAMAPLAAVLGAAPLLAQDASPVAEDGAGDRLTRGVTPERVAAAVEQIPDLAATVLEQSGAPGMAVAVVFDDEVIFSEGFGVRDVTTGEAVDAETVFMLASVSKPISATVVSAVVGDGEISWNTKMADLDPGFGLHEAWPTENVTLADLFAHRSGLKDHAGDVLEDLGYGREEIIHRLRYLEPQYSFRDGYAYGNFGLTAAANAVARSLGTTWEELSAERLYEPLGMSKTSSLLADFLAQPNHAVPHVRDGEEWVLAPMQRDPDPQSPAGGAYSTVVDVAQWLRLQIGQGRYEGQELIPAAALAPMHLPQSLSRVPGNPAVDRAGFYGLGINVSFTDDGAIQWGHSGAFSLGAATAVFMLPGSGFGIVALSNSIGPGAPEALCLSVLDIVTTGSIGNDWYPFVQGIVAAGAEEENYSEIADWAAPPADAASALSDASYVGMYRDDFYGGIEIAAGSAGLVLRIGPAPLEFPLTHYTRDTFSWQPIGENALGPSGLTFLVGPDGSATAFHDEYLAKHGPGLIERATE
jgi:CubicO group peptidase (beta-lactamase class C family)